MSVPMKNNRYKLNQRGIVSIVVTMILMIVITLIVLSFAKISRREQRNALDRQLSTQAFYAAESGVNDAKTAIASWSVNDGRFDIDYTTDCTSFAAAITPTPLPLNQSLFASSAAAYTCLFVDPSPPKVIYPKSDEQHVLPIKDKNGAAISTIEIYWDNGNVTGFLGCPDPSNNPTTWPSNCDAPVLRVELVDADPATPAPNDLTTSKVFFIYPKAFTGGTISYGSTTGETAEGNCSVPAPPTPPNPNRCKIVIDGLGAAGYFLRVKGIYDLAALTITANSGAAELTGAQVLIDATGKATDVERRIQVRVPANTLSSKVPLFGVEGTDKICKKFSIYGTGASNDGLCWTGGVPD